MDFKLDLLAQIVGRNFGITVRPGRGFAISKDDAGKLVVFVPPMSVGNEEDAMIVRSGLCHEAVGHGRHTDFSAKRGPSPLHLAMENILEDARIEKAAWKIYPKTRRILEEGMAAMHKRNMLKRTSNQSTPAEIASIAVLIRLMVEELGYCTKLIDWKVDWADAVQCFGNETMNKVWAKAVAGYQTKSTDEVIGEAAEIVKLLQNGFQDQQQNPEKGKAEKGGDKQSKQDGKSDGGPNGDSNDKSGDGSSGEDQDGQDGSSKADESQGDDGSGSGAGSGDDGDETRESDSDTGSGESGGSRKQPGTGAGSSHALGDTLDLKKVNPKEFDRGDLLKSQIENKIVSGRNAINVYDAHNGEFVPPVQGKAAAQRLKSALTQRLLAVVEDEEDSLVEYGVLAGHRLVDARMGDRDVFVEPGKPGERLDTAFSLLIDASGSMHGEPANACMAATWAIGSTLNGYAGMGMALAISSFNGVLYRLKNWEQPWKRGECLAGYIPGGSTATYEAMENRLEHLAKRREPRKVLFLITDGDIGNLSSLVNTATEAGIEIVVMMIGDERNKPNAPYLKRLSVIQPQNIATEMLKTVISLF